eukprot:48685_1
MSILPPYQGDACHNLRQCSESDIKNDVDPEPSVMPPPYSSDDETQHSESKPHRLLRHSDGTFIDSDNFAEFQYQTSCASISIRGGSVQYGWPEEFWKRKRMMELGFSICVLARSKDHKLYRMYCRPPGFLYYIEMRGT